MIAVFSCYTRLLGARHKVSALSPFVAGPFMRFFQYGDRVIGSARGRGCLTRLRFVVLWFSMAENNMPKTFVLAAVAGVTLAACSLKAPPAVLDARSSPSAAWPVDDQPPPTEPLSSAPTIKGVGTIGAFDVKTASVIVAHLSMPGISHPAMHMFFTVSDP